MVYYNLYIYVHMEFNDVKKDAAHEPVPTL